MYLYIYCLYRCSTSKYAYLMCILLILSLLFLYAQYYLMSQLYVYLTHIVYMPILCVSLQYTAYIGVPQVNMPILCAFCLYYPYYILICAVLLKVSIVCVSYSYCLHMCNRRKNPFVAFSYPIHRSVMHVNSLSYVHLTYTVFISLKC